MHHSEIGKLVDIFQEMHVLNEDIYPVKIESYLQECGRSGQMSIGLITDLAKGYLKVEVINSQKDSNTFYIAYFLDKLSSEPVEIFECSHEDFSVDSIKSFVRKLASIDKTDQDVSVLGDSNKIYCKYRIRRNGWMEELNNIMIKNVIRSAKLSPRELL
jgi:hypothetical protein